MRTVYLASRFSRQRELRRYADQLRRRGYRTTARWLYAHAALDQDTTTYNTTRARADVEDVSHADATVLFTEQPRTIRTRGGRHFEAGLAYGLKRKLIVVGPREHVFCYLPDVPVYEDWQQAVLAEFPPRLDALGSRRSDQPAT